MLEQAAVIPDRRAVEIRHLGTPCVMPVYRTREEWLARAKTLREQILVSAGLWPMPEKTPLKARVFGRVERDGYAVEKVILQTLPGFCLCGNLFRPLGKGSGAGILHPHGHTPLQVGRLGHAEATGATLARLGAAVFSYDMVGYVDTNQMPHRFGGPREYLWGISLLGLQLWNSIRAADFLTGLPDIDPARIGCVGASGGGTQTFMLAAVDQRIAVSIPVVMVSSTMQGGCLCENAPGLRIDTNNMEIAALAAPRPQRLIAATGDWTRLTPEVEYPAVRGIYRLFDAEEKIDYRIFDSPHAYNLEMREAVYAWFGRWLLGIDDPEQCREAAHPDDQTLDLLVFYGLTPPAGRLDAESLSAQMIASAQKRAAGLAPRGSRGLARLRATLGIALQRALAAESPAPEQVAVLQEHSVTIGGQPATGLVFGRKERGDAIPALLLQPPVGNGTGVIVADARGKAAVADPAACTISPLAQELLRAGCAVLAIDCFATGASPAPQPDPSIHYLETYNRTDAANRVQDILTAMACLKGAFGMTRIVLVGDGPAGLWAMLAAGIAAPDVLVADAAQFDIDDDSAYLAYCYVPSLRQSGGFETACALAYPSRQLIHNTGNAFRLQWTPELYGSRKAGASFRMATGKVQIGEIIEWIKG